MSFDFEYATTRIKGMKARLLSESKLRELLGVKSISEMVQLLEESDYKDELVALSTKYQGMELIMRALHENFKNSLQKLVKINPEEGRVALKLLLQDFQIQNINTLISAKAAGIEISETDLIILDKDEEKFIEKLKACKSLEELIKRLRRTEYKAALKNAGKDFEKTQDFRIYRRALSAYYFDKLRTLRKEEEDLLWKLIVWRNNVRNIMVILRIKRSVPNEDALKYLVSKDDRLAKELNKMGDFNKMLERVARKYPRVANAVEECIKLNTLIPLEIALEREFIRKTMRMLRVAVLDFAVVLGYLYLKEEEIGTVRKIAYAKQYDFTDELKGMIFSFNA
ncbi:MAG: V-type ATPase subunit [Candidatus Micrarchaeota archaeon]